MILNDNQIIQFVSKFTMVSKERLLNVLSLIDDVVKNNVPGDFIEIGVCKGGIIMAMALKCKQLGITRTIHAYDTFQGMTKPTEQDVDLNGNKASDILESVLCYSSFEDTVNNINKCDYQFIKYHIGNILDTDINTIPNSIAILRLDTDWYDLTKFELNHFDKYVVPCGYIIIDDYGHWNGCKKAVDEYLINKDITINKIDYTGIYWKK